MSDRRRRVRFQVDKQTYCYLDGCRFDTQTTDMSASGAFLSTTDEVSLGALIIVLFEEDSTHELAVHLVGRVVRRQREPIPGIGVAWVRAVTGGDVGQLTNFLYDALSLSSLDTVPHIKDDAGRTWYEFNPPPSELDRQGPRLPANVIPLLPRTRERGSGFFIVRTEEAPKPDQSVIGGVETPAFRQRGGQGPITRMIEQDQTRFAVDIPVALTVGHTTLQVQLTTIGRSGLTVRTDILPAHERSPMMITLQVPTRDTVATVILTCELEERVQPAGARPAQLGLTIRRVVDESWSGLFDRYLKWLQCRDVSAAEG